MSEVTYAQACVLSAAAFAVQWWREGGEPSVCLHALAKDVDAYLAENEAEGVPDVITYEQQAQSIEAVQAADQVWRSEPGNIVITKQFTQVKVVPDTVPMETPPPVRWIDAGPKPYYQRNTDGKWEATNCLDLDR